jgi:signal transduction histidine kinase
VATPVHTPGEDALRVLVLATFGRNAEVLRRVIEENGMRCRVCADVQDMLREIESGAGAVVLSSLRFVAREVEPLTLMLENQAAWSDLPVIVITHADDPARSSVVEALRCSANLTLLQGPARGFTLATVLRSALRARARQYEMRDLLRRECAAREEAERANRAKDEFLATVTHELGTPLSAILLWSKLAVTGAVPPGEFPQTLERIYRSALAQNILIDDLLDASRIASGQLTIAAHPIQLAPAIAGAVEIVRPSADEKGVRLAVALNENAGLVEADLARMRQVAWNILTNAIKFTSAGGEVRVTLQRESRHVRFQVSDTGHGISADFLPHVFEPFRQGEAGYSRRTTGLGLGLAITQQLVELQGGRIIARSDGRGRGATFIVDLDVVDAPNICHSDAEPVCEVAKK